MTKETEFKKFGSSPEELQRIVDTVIPGLRSQGFQRSRGINNWGHTSCRVRGDEGRKCAAGWLLPDDMYEPDDEVLGYTFEKVLDGYGYGPNTSLVHGLQATHDTYDTPEVMEVKLRELVKDVGLIWPEAV